MSHTPPFIDERVEYMGVSKIRYLNRTELARLDRLVLVQGEDFKPLAVIMPIGIYLKLQQIALQQLGPILDTLPEVES